MAATRAWLIFFGSVCPSLRQDISDSLARAGVEARAFDPDEPAGPGLLVLDEMTPCVGEFLREVSDRGLERILTIATTSASLAGGLAWRLLQAGASDVFAWDHSGRSAGEVAARLRRWEVVDQLVRSPLVRKNCIGRSPAWVRALRQIVEMARFTDTPALITGETGTGKELAARLIHTLEDRPEKRDLVVPDCTTIAPELSGSEFFGHERGAFTGAFALADGGTLFLDEVGELPLTLQAELLRVVQERTYKRVGSNDWRQTNFRLVCATNRELLREEALGQFRRDLYYRIAGWTCRLPPPARSHRGHPSAGRALHAAAPARRGGPGARRRGARVSAPAGLPGQRARPQACRRADDVAARGPGPDHRGRHPRGGSALGRLRSHRMV